MSESNDIISVALGLVLGLAGCSLKPVGQQVDICRLDAMQRKLHNDPTIMHDYVRTCMGVNGYAFNQECWVGSSEEARCYVPIARSK